MRANYVWETPYPPMNTMEDKRERGVRWMDRASTERVHPRNFTTTARQRCLGNVGDPQEAPPLYPPVEAWRRVEGFTLMSARVLGRMDYRVRCRCTGPVWRATGHGRRSQGPAHVVGVGGGAQGVLAQVLRCS